MYFIIQHDPPSLKYSPVLKNLYSELFPCSRHKSCRMRTSAVRQLVWNKLYSLWLP
jgi:hypothetical protein